MTLEKQRIAIAKACGWTQSSAGWWFNRENTNGGDPEPPDYLNDLNAMHEAWKILNRKQLIIAANKLVNLSGGTEAAMDATAAHLAEVLLRTLNLWED